MNKRKMITGILSVSLLIQPIVTSIAYGAKAEQITRTLDIGTEGDDVASVQQRLKDLDYFKYTATGYFGNITKKAVEEFQKDHELGVDGIVGKATLEALNVSHDSEKQISRGSERRLDFAELEWFKGINNVVSIGTIMKITDVETGQKFLAKRTYGVNHADSETLTKEDTAIMKGLYNNKWSWDRRSIVVEINNLRLPASMAGMPHSLDSINDNNMEGHFDIHFLNSRTHGTNKIDPDHQDAVKTASEFISKGKLDE